MCTLIDCVFRHGDQCDMCNCQVLDPLDPEQREAHATVRKFCSSTHATFLITQAGFSSDFL